MTWQEFAAARQLLVEEKIGAVAREARRREDEIARQTRKHAAKER